jgi:hypothetical protein
MSAEANEWHPPQEGMHSHATRGPLASLSENVAAIPGGEEVRISRVATFPSAKRFFRDTFLSSHTSPSRPTHVPGVDVFIDRQHI